MDDTALFKKVVSLVLKDKSKAERWSQAPENKSSMVASIVATASMQRADHPDAGKFGSYLKNAKNLAATERFLSEMEPKAWVGLNVH